MDFFTHFVVPFAILTLLKVKDFNVKDRLSGGFGGISVDFDFILFAIGFLSPELFIFTHRGITHSFVFGLVTAIVFIYIISRPRVYGLINHMIKRDISVEFNWKSVLLAYFGVLTHLFLDFLTTGGIPLLYPFSLTRFSANLYYYTDLVTTIVALGVLIILYLRLNPKYKKLALTGFLIMLISFGGIRAYEKMDALESQTLSEGYTQITAYPTQDMFTWTMVESDGGGRYLVFTYNTWNKVSSNLREINNLSITNGSYESGQEAIKYANTLPEVEKFRWTSPYTAINATKTGSLWNVTYTDFVGTHYGASELSVLVP
jgi:inner membrane protein